MRKGLYIFLGLVAFVILARFTGNAPGQILRKKLEERRAERMGQTAQVNPRGPAACGSALNLGFHIQTFSTGLRAAVWYPTKMAEAPFRYADNMSSALAENAPVADCAEYPMVVFSHGFGGCGTQSLFFTEQLARAGYIVVAPDHKDSQCKVDQPRQRGFGSMMFHRAEEPFKQPEKWDDSTYTDRKRDIQTVLNEMSRDSIVGRRIDRMRIAGAGHSLGGYTIAAMAGAWPSWKDNRIKAALLMSPYIEPFLAKGTMRSLSVPVMYQGGTRDRGITPKVAQPGGAYDASNRPKFFVEFQDAGHLGWTIMTCMSYGATSTCSEEAPLARQINEYGIGFLDRYLKGRSEAILDRPNSQLADLRHAE